MTDFKLECPGCKKTDPRCFTLRIPITHLHRVYGVVQGELAYKDKWDDSEHEHPTTLLCACGFSFEFERSVDRDNDFRFADTAEFDEAVDLERAGTSHLNCHCPEPDLNDLGINYRIFTDSSTALERPAVRGWFDASFRLLLKCPSCRGNLLTKHSTMIRDAATAAEALKRAKL